MQSPQQFATMEGMSYRQTKRPSVVKWLGIFAIAISLMVGLLLQQTQHDELIKFVPVDAVAYVHLKNLTAEDKKNLSQFQNYFLALDKKLKLEENYFFQEILLSSKELGIFFVPNYFDNSFDVGALVVFEEGTERQNSKLTKNIFLLTSEKSLEEKIFEVKDGKIFNAELKFLDLKFDDSPINIHLDTENLVNTFYVQPLSWHSFSYSLRQFASGPLHLGAQPTEFGISFQSFPGSRVSKADDEPSQISFRPLPEETVAYFSDVTLSEVADLGQLISLPSSNSLKRLSGSFDQVYGFDVEKFWRSLSEKKVELLLTKSASGDHDGHEALTLRLTDDHDQINLDQFEEAVKISLAHLSPEERFRRLPDGTYVTELIGDPQAYEWTTVYPESIRPIRRLTEPGLPFELTYVADSDGLIISSSFEVLSDLIRLQSADLETQKLLQPSTRLDSCWQKFPLGSDRTFVDLATLNMLTSTTSASIATSTQLDIIAFQKSNKNNLQGCYLLRNK